MKDISEDQRLMLLSAARRMLGEMSGLVDTCEKDFAWEQVFGSSAELLSDARHMLSLAKESEENWKRLLKQLR